MRNINLPVSLIILSFLYGCTAGDVQMGRTALMNNKPDVALGYFQRAAERDPNYIMNFGTFREGVWTYMGRAQYVTGKLPQARQSLERAVASDKDDYLAKLYLGLTLARDGDRQRGLTEMQSGLQGLHDWLDWVEIYTSYGVYWDPMRQIRNEIKTNLAIVSSKEIDWQKLIAGGEDIGNKMEEEIDRSRTDEIESHFKQRSD